MIRWGLALFALGLVWPVTPAWAFWTGTVICCAGGMLAGWGLGNRRRARGRR